jgi:hypothetical protein
VTPCSVALLVTPVAAGPHGHAVSPNIGAAAVVDAVVVDPPAVVVVVPAVRDDAHALATSTKATPAASQRWRLCRVIDDSPRNLCRPRRDSPTAEDDGVSDDPSKGPTGAT